MWYLWEANNGKFSVTLRLEREFVCGRCSKQVDGLVEPVEELCERFPLFGG